MTCTLSATQRRRRRWASCWQLRYFFAIWLLSWWCCWRYNTFASQEENRLYSSPQEDPARPRRRLRGTYQVPCTSIAVVLYQMLLMCSLAIRVLYRLRLRLVAYWHLVRTDSSSTCCASQQNNCSTSTAVPRAVPPAHLVGLTAPYGLRTGTCTRTAYYYYISSKLPVIAALLHLSY